MQRGTIDIFDFTGGLNTKLSSGAVADNEYVESNNCYIVGTAIAKRKGFARYNGGVRIYGSNQGTGIYQANFVDYGDQVVAVAGSKISKKASDAWTDITGSVVVSSNNPVIFAMINNDLVGVNGVDPAWYYTGTGSATVLSGNNIPTAPTACESFHGRLFLSEGRKLRWSEYMGNWTQDFRDDAFQDFDDAITGLKILGDANQSVLLVFTDNSINICIFDPSIGVQVGGAGSFRFDKITQKHGCVSAASIQECITASGDIVVIFADNDGLKAVGGDQKVVKLTDNIQPTWDGIDFENIGVTSGVFYKPKDWYLYFYAEAGQTNHNKVIVFDLRIWKTVGIFDWAISSAGIVVIDGVDSIVGSDFSGYWNQYDYGQNDNGEAISANVRTKTYDGQVPHVKKGVKSVQLQYANFGQFVLTIKTYFDYTGEKYISTLTMGENQPVLGTFILDQDILGESGQYAISDAEVRGWGRTVQFEIENNEADEPFRIHRIIGNHVLGRPVF